MVTSLDVVSAIIQRRTSKLNWGWQSRPGRPEPPREDGALHHPCADSNHIGRSAALPREFPANRENYREFYSPNTNIMVCWRISRSSGVKTCRVFDTRLSPVRIATYCLPPASNVIGGAENPVPTLIFHNCSS